MGFYNIHTNFQAPPPHANFAHTLKENRAVEKKNEQNTTFVLF